MSTRRHIAALSAAANALARKAGRAAPFSLACFSDPARLKNPDVIARLLPKGSAFIYRPYDSASRGVRARRLKSICDASGVKLIIGGDVSLAIDVMAAGVHLPSWLSRTINTAAIDHVRRALPGCIVSAACHDVAQIMRANRLGADVCFLSPVFATQSHPGADHLSAVTITACLNAAKIPVLALGGVELENMGHLQAHGFAGFGAIGTFAKSA